VPPPEPKLPENHSTVRLPSSRITPPVARMIFPSPPAVQPAPRAEKVGSRAAFSIVGLPNLARLYRQIRRHYLTAYKHSSSGEELKESRVLPMSQASWHKSKALHWMWPKSRNRPDFNDLAAVIYNVKFNRDLERNKSSGYAAVMYKLLLRNELGRAVDISIPTLLCALIAPREAIRLCKALPPRSSCLCAVDRDE
jgi:hypothetical protein